MIYELWNTRTRNLVDSFSSKSAALMAARKIIEANGPDFARNLALAQEDSRGNTRLIASGADLIVNLDRAEEAPRARKTSRKRRRPTPSAPDRPIDAHAAIFWDQQSR